MNMPQYQKKGQYHMNGQYHIHMKGHHMNMYGQYAAHEAAVGGVVVVEVVGGLAAASDVAEADADALDALAAEAIAAIALPRMAAMLASIIGLTMGIMGIMGILLGHALGLSAVFDTSCGSARTSSSSASISAAFLSFLTELRAVLVERAALKRLWAGLSETALLVSLATSVSTAVAIAKQTSNKRASMVMV